MTAAALQRSAALDHVLDPTTISANDFAFADFLKREHNFGIDGDRPVCKSYLEGHCPLGDKCPDKHPIRNYHGTMICKHWLRGLCKKGNNCEFLHEFNLREAPECPQFARYLNCNNGPECLFLHIDPDLKAPPCEHYERGFCALGPHCAAKHVKKKAICTYYLAGFCPNGRSCEEGAHPLWREKEEMTKQKRKVYLTEEEKEAEREKKRAKLEEDREEEERKFQDRPFQERSQRDRPQGRGRGGRRVWSRPRLRDRY